MRRWFLTQETELLNSRILNITLQERKDFFQQYKDEFCLETVEVPDDTKDVCKEADRVFDACMECIGYVQLLSLP